MLHLIKIITERLDCLSLYFKISLLLLFFFCFFNLIFKKFHTVKTNLYSSLPLHCGPFFSCPLVFEQRLLIKNLSVVQNYFQYKIKHRLNAFNHSKLIFDFKIHLKIFFLFNFISKKLVMGSVLFKIL